jgi:hypothetical protein
VLLIYSPISSTRLDYICATLFNKAVSITSDKTLYLTCTYAKINYSEELLSDDDVRIIPAGLLFQNNIQDQQIQCFEWNGLTRFYETESGDLPFDLFSAAFYLIFYLINMNDTGIQIVWLIKIISYTCPLCNYG